MRHTNSPMRYPGSKAVIAEYIGEILVRNHMHGATYVEPFCGGSSVALDLLYSEQVSRVVLNDIDYRLFSFWDAILRKPEEFCDQLRRTPVTMEERENQMEIYRHPEQYAPFYVGFACFFLNKTNRSGILTGGPIGGTEQSGPWKITTKFGKDYFYRVIRKFARYKDRIQLHNLDAVGFLEKVVRPIEKTFIFLDPPYHGVGKELYKDHYFVDKDHCRLAQALQEVDKPWLMTYDDVPEIRALYSDNTVEDLQMYYHTYAKKNKDEILIYGNCQPVRRMAEVR
jgi:DNA adenine methylase